LFHPLDGDLATVEECGRRERVGVYTRVELCDPPFRSTPPLTGRITLGFLAGFVFLAGGGDLVPCGRADGAIAGYSSLSPFGGTIVTPIFAISRRTLSRHSGVPPETSASVLTVLPSRSFIRLAASSFAILFSFMGGIALVDLSGGGIVGGVHGCVDMDGKHPRKLP
jgi:hypothetical protein